MKKPSYYLASLLICIFISCSEENQIIDDEILTSNLETSKSTTGRYVFHDGWETGCWRAFRHKKSTGGSCNIGSRWNNSQMQTNSAGKAVDFVGELANPAPTREGNYSMKFTWFRSSFRLDDPNNRSKAHLWTGLENKRNTTRWYGFSMYLPSGAGGMESDEEDELLVQWHGYPDTAAGEPYRIPTAAILHIKDRLVFNYFYDENEISQGTIKPGGKVELGKADLDQWIDFIIKIKWSPEGNGMLEIRRKDQVAGADWKVLVNETENVYIGYNDSSDPSVGIGIYKFDAAKRYEEGLPISDYYRRQVFFDSFRIGNELAKAQDVMPKGSLGEN
ncbi:heparin lyase I family protein [uncultured Aquimarina sp.]|uniref:heparin lyase I family protein n=1 Tax=uncultured Aquimarina sp. TaxID=575652 RepID=UPI002622B2EE|nr:heparin lyase I family protein [uncultured Aquimarina sp.]